jgi:hypothetical protein
LVENHVSIKADFMPANCSSVFQQQLQRDTRKDQKAETKMKQKRDIGYDAQPVIIREI